MSAHSLISPACQLSASTGPAQAQAGNGEGIVVAGGAEAEVQQRALALAVGDAQPGGGVRFGSHVAGDYRRPATSGIIRPHGTARRRRKLPARPAGPDLRRPRSRRTARALRRGRMDPRRPPARRRPLARAQGRRAVRAGRRRLFRRRRRRRCRRRRPRCARNWPGARWRALGVSLVVHPRNPHVPTSHANVRYFEAQPPRASRCGGSAAASTSRPSIRSPRTCVHWHRTARDAVRAASSRERYAAHKAWCDRYFHLKHRDEARGVGGLFFDDLNADGFERSFAYQRAVGDGFLDAYLPIVERAPRHALRRARARVPAVPARPLRRVQPGLGPRHAVRPAVAAVAPRAS